MSLAISTLTNLSNLCSPEIKERKDIVIGFLKEIFRNFLRRSNNKFNYYTFQEITRIPLIIAEKVFTAISSRSNSVIAQTTFAQGIHNCLFGTLEQKVLFTFNVFDFDNDNIVKINDIFLILSHFHLIENSSDYIKLLEEVINDFFRDKREINKKEYLSICKSTNCNLSILLIIFMNNYLCFFQENEIYYYKQYVKDEDIIYNTKENDRHDEIDSYNIMEDVYFKPTSVLVNYLNVIKLKQNYSFYHKETESSFSNDIDELKDLSFFEEDILDAFRNLASLTQKRNNMQIAKKNSISIITSHIPYETCKHIKQSYLSKDIILKTTQMSTNIEENNNDSPYIELKHCGSKITKSFTIFSTTCINQGRDINEFYFYNSSEFISTNLVKLVLINSFVFYFINKDNKVFEFKKLIPLYSLFPKKVFLNGKTFLALISTVHNFYQKYSLYGENAQIDAFITLCNKNIGNSTKIEDDYDLIEEIGHGKFGTVILAKEKATGKLVAIKKIQKGNLTEEDYKINRWEFSIFSLLKSINHPNVIKGFKEYETEQYFYLVYEYIKGNDLKNYVKKANNYFTAKNSLKISYEIMKGVSCLHKYGIIHRDLKPANILLDINWENMETGYIKIIDFGLSRVMGENEFSIDPYGSLCFKAPELIQKKPYNFKVDIWALGITMFYIFFQKTPFIKNTEDEIRESIVVDRVKFPIIFAPCESERSNKDCLSIIYEIIEDCLEKSKEDRPNINVLVKKLIGYV